MSAKYCYSWDGEIYYGEFDSEKEALENAKGDEADAESVFIGTCTEPVLRWGRCEENIIESICENLYEDVGEASENFEVSTEDELELGKMVDETVRKWIDEKKIKPSCYAVIDGHEVSLVSN